MACNVYLTFFHDYDAARLRSLELRYLVFCYGLPFIPAFAYCFVQSTERGKVYGSAIVRVHPCRTCTRSLANRLIKLWCWVSLEWDILRIATFYAPVWIIIIATVVIYVRAGLVVFKWRDMVLALAHSHNPPASSNDEGKSSLQVSKIARPSAEDATGASKNKYVPERKAATNISKHQPSVSMETSNDALQGRNEGKPEITTGFAPAIAQRNQSVVSSMTSRSLPTSAQAKKAAVNYCHCAVLFFAALLVTWVPSSINRVYTLVHPESFVFGLNYVSALVLPLQGFWNSVVYAVTSFAACKAMFEKFGKRAHKAQQPDMSVELGSDSEVGVLSNPSPFQVDA